MFLSSDILEQSIIYNIQYVSVTHKLIQEPRNMSNFFYPQSLQIFYTTERFFIKV